MTSRQRIEDRSVRVLRHPFAWLATLGGIVLAGIMTFAYLGAFSNPMGELEGLPVGVVNLDQPVEAGSQRVAIGDTVMSALAQSTNTQITWREYATEDEVLAAIGDNVIAGAVVLPATLSADVGKIGTSLGDAPQAQVDVYRNAGAGSLQPQAVDTATTAFLSELNQQVSSTLTSAITQAGASIDADHVGPLGQPVVANRTDRPDIGTKGGLGLPPLYIAVMTTLSGVIGAIGIHVVVGLRVGRERFEIIGRTVRIEEVEASPLRRFLAELFLVLVLAVASAVVIPTVAIGLIGTTADDVRLVGLVCGLGVLTMGALTLLCVIAFGVLGEIVVVLLTTIFGVPSSRGVYPKEALPGFFQALGEFLPMRYLTDALRSAMYFDGRAAAGLQRGIVALVLWLVGSVIVATLVSLVMQRRDSRHSDDDADALVLEPA